ncbi:glycine-rich protein 2-like [Quercus robur]|uniref:glycine-rich protein 2-like n=1 Tax=Quercus robur TaxID=38942 RepID=UPI00216203DA|nr:glycine-rich protein 2-like [Quercus robur]
MAVIVVYCREYIILSCGGGSEGGRRVGSGNSGIGNGRVGGNGGGDGSGGGSGNDSDCSGGGRVGGGSGSGGDSGSDSTVEDNGDMVYNLLLEYASGGSLRDLIHNSGGCGLPESDVKRSRVGVVDAFTFNFVL